MNKSIFKLSACAMAVLLASALPSISTAATSDTITGGFDVGPGGFQGNFNSLAATGGFTWLSKYLEPLIIYDGKLDKIVGDLAKSWDISADSKTITFKLEDAKWHDGKAFTAADVKFTLGLAQNNQSGSVFAARLKNVASVETPDEHTVVITLNHPETSIFDTLSKVLMLPKHALEKIPVKELAKNSWWSTKPIGTGPFKFEKYVTDQYVELKANVDYRKGMPKVTHLINRYFANSAGAVAALRSGEIQFTYVDSNDLATFKDKPDFKVIQGDSYVINYLGFNQQLPYFKDARIRQAFMYAINRDAIIKSLYGGGAKLAQCVYVADKYIPKDITQYSYDPAKAKQLLAEAGWDKLNGSKPIDLMTYYNTPLATNTLAAIQAMLAQVGVNIIPKAVDTPTFNSTVYSNDPQKVMQAAMVFAGTGNGPEPANANVGLNTNQIPPLGANIMRVSIPELDNAFNSAASEVDEAKRAKDYQDACKVSNAQVPWATLWVAQRYGVVSTKLQNFTWLPAPGGGPYDDNSYQWEIK